MNWIVYGRKENIREVKVTYRLNHFAKAADQIQFSSMSVGHIQMLGLLITHTQAHTFIVCTLFPNQLKLIVYCTFADVFAVFANGADIEPKQCCIREQLWCRTIAPLFHKAENFSTRRQESTKYKRAI